MISALRVGTDTGCGGTSLSSGLWYTGAPHFGARICCKSHLTGAEWSGAIAVSSEFACIVDLSSIFRIAQQSGKTAQKQRCYCFCNSNIFEAVYATNLLIPVTDLLVTKPSELAYYPIPKLMIRHIGGHEVYGAIHTSELGDGTPEFEKEADTLRALDNLIQDKELTLHMLDNIDKLKAQGTYNGAYECVKLAAGVCD